jgi:transcriptional regulator with XRE-family HTH domain
MSSKGITRKEQYKITLKEIGEKLAELRKQKGYKSQTDFALEYQLPQTQYWRMEKGNANLTFKSLDRVLAIHGLTITQLFQMLGKENVRIHKSQLRDDFRDIPAAS